MQSCETAIEHLERYAAVSQVNHAWMDAMNDTIGKLPPVENGVAREQMESTAVSFD